MWKPSARSSKEKAMARDKSGALANVSSGAPSIISADVQLVGDLTSPGEVQLDGIIEGSVRSRLLTIGEGGSVKGKVVAERATIHGRVEGELRVKILRLGAKAEIVGDIHQESIAIEAGAKVSGHIHLGIDRNEPLRGPTAARTSVIGEHRDTTAGTTLEPASAATIGGAQDAPRKLPA